MRKGGSYIVENGKPKKVEGTKAHPEGNRARDKDGNVVGEKAEPKQPAAPAEKKGK